MLCYRCTRRNKGVLLLLLLFSYKLAKSDKFSVGLIAQLGEHWFGIVQDGSESIIFQQFLSILLSSVHNYIDLKT